LGISRSGKESEQEPSMIPEMQDTCSPRENISINDAKMLIKSYFEQHHGEELDYVDLVDALCLPLSVFVEACGELEKEGKIAGVD
jgi:hypothetical protein